MGTSKLNKIMKNFIESFSQTDIIAHFLSLILCAAEHQTISVYDTKSLLY